MGVRTEIIAERVLNASYNAQNNAGKLGKMVKKDLNGSKWTVKIGNTDVTTSSPSDDTAGSAIKMIYRDSSLNNTKAEDSHTIVYTIELPGEGETEVTLKKDGTEMSSGGSTSGTTPTPTTYTIATTVTNGTFTGATSIEENGTATITITADTNYELPSTVTVIGATQNYNNSTGEISLSNPTGNVTITAACSIPVSTFGKYVNYEVDLNGDGNTTNDWRVFYNDGTNVYLIAADYVPVSKLTSLINKENQSIKDASGMKTEGTYTVYWENDTDFKTYKGTTGQASTQSNGAPDLFANRPTGTSYLIDNLGLLSLLKSKRNQVLESAGVDANSATLRMTATLMDTKVWEPFVASSCSTASKYNSSSCYAIGGPTIDLWVSSWNEMQSRYTGEDDVRIYLACDSGSRFGYYIGSGDNLSTVRAGTSVGVSETTMNVTTGFEDTLYYPHTAPYGNCYSFWLASPLNVYGNKGECAIRCNGAVDGYDFNQKYSGIRPVVVLQSDVKVQAPASGDVYTIVNK